MESPHPIPRVDLAREWDFMLGDLTVRPSRCQVEASGERRALERRVMQVLVALAHPTWEVVSRQELIVRCWNGLSVSDDAIQRCIGALRRLAADWPEPPFEIETIGRVGYYLKTSVPGPQASPERLPGSRSPWPSPRSSPSFATDSGERWPSLERRSIG
jgi:DNA-binding winged helix-turn-helix (wHTH) protein